VSTGVATLRAWSPAATADIVGDVALSSSGRTVFVGGRSTGGYVQAYGPTAGGAPVWNVATNGDVEALAIASTTLYVGGHFTTVGAGDRDHLAAITSGGVAFGGEFTQVSGDAHQGVVQFTGAAKPAEQVPLQWGHTQVAGPALLWRNRVRCARTGRRSPPDQGSSWPGW
jgi:hypothetical protein